MCSLIIVLSVLALSFIEVCSLVRCSLLVPKDKLHSVLPVSCPSCAKLVAKAALVLVVSLLCLVLLQELLKVG